MSINSIVEIIYKESIQEKYILNLLDKGEEIDIFQRKNDRIFLS